MPIAGASDRRLARAANRHTKPEIISAILEAAEAAGIGCDWDSACKVFRVFERASDRIEVYGEPYHLTRHELHELKLVIDAVMPPGAAVPQPGSAHELVSNYFLRGSRGYRLVQRKAGGRGGGYAIAKTNGRR